MLPSAKTDLVNILEYITRKSGNLIVGRQFVGALRQQCRELASLPGTIGRARPELRAESDGSRTGFRRKPDSVPMIADSR